MANRREERKGDLMATAMNGALWLALGWVALEVAWRGLREFVKQPEPKEVEMQDPAVLLVEQVANEAKMKDSAAEGDENGEAKADKEPQLVHTK